MAVRSTLARVAALAVAAAAVAAIPGRAVAGASTSSTTLPVVACKTTFGIDDTPHFWVPQRLTTTIPTASARRLEFYSNGRITVLAPRGWACEAGVGANGSEGFDVTPHPQDPDSTEPITGFVVDVARDYTGHGPGAQLVCGYFPSSPAALLAADTGGCPALPQGETFRSVTPDLGTFRDPDGTTGAALYPQVGADERGGVTVTVVRCHLPKQTRNLCPSIVADEIVRSPADFEYPAS